MTSFCPSGEWEKELVPFSALRDFGRRQGTAFHTPPYDADDPSPSRTVSHDLFLGSYVTSEADLGSTGSTTIQTVFPHVQAGEDSHLAIFTAPHVMQVNRHHIIVKSHGSGVRGCQGSSQAAPLPSARHQALACALCRHLGNGSKTSTFLPELSSSGEDSQGSSALGPGSSQGWLVRAITNGS